MPNPNPDANPNPNPNTSPNPNPPVTASRYAAQQGEAESDDDDQYVTVGKLHYIACQKAYDEMYRDSEPVDAVGRYLLREHEM